MSELDSPERIHELRALIRSKPALSAIYSEIYEEYARVLERSPSDGIALELGSGAGFAQERIPSLMTSDTIPYEGIDRVVDATAMPFRDGELRAILLMNVLHHIPDVAAFFREAERCLKPGGRILIVDQYPGWISTPILKHAHHEPFDAAAPEWKFASSGPLSGANGALAWIVFERDHARFEREFPGLRLERTQVHTPLRYWLSGGLKSWSLLPGWAFGFATVLDHALVGVTRRFGSFWNIELVRL